MENTPLSPHFCKETQNFPLEFQYGKEGQRGEKPGLSQGL